MPAAATDSFVAANGTALTTYDADWSLNSGNFAIQGNAAVANGALATTECGAHRTDVVATDDQGSRGTIKSISGGGTNQREGVGVRMALDNSANYYGVYYDDDLNEAYFFKNIAGTITQLGATISVVLVATNKIRLDIIANLLELFFDTGSGYASQGTRTDSALPTGAWGITGKGITTVERIGDWEGWNLGVVPSGPPGGNYGVAIQQRAG